MGSSTPSSAAAAAASRSFTDLQALHRSGRSKLVLLVSLLVMALGAAGWSLARSGSAGTGNADRPDKVLLVAEGVSHKTYLWALGFEADEQTFDHLEDKARQEVPDLDVTGVPAILALADRFGYGYVVFADPWGLDYSMLEVEGTMPEITPEMSYLVISAGDLASPHRVSAGPNLVVTLFEQPQLAELVPPREPSTAEGRRLRDHLRTAIEQRNEDARRLAKQGR